MSKQTAVMNYVSKFLSNFKEFYNDINSATLTGAIDVVVVKQDNGTYTCSPFHVRFGKIGVLRSRAKIVDIEINGEPVDIHMKLGETGEAFFVEETEEHDEIPSHLATSPIPLFPDIEKELAKLHEEEARSHQFDPELSIIGGNEEPCSQHESNEVLITVENTDENISMQGSIYHEVSETMTSNTPTKEEGTSEVSLDIGDEESIKDALHTETSTIDIHTDKSSETAIARTFDIGEPTRSDKTTERPTSIHMPIESRAHVNSIPIQQPSFLPISSSQDNLHVKLESNDYIQSSVSPEPVLSSLALAANEDEKLKMKKKRRKRSSVRKKKNQEAEESSDDEPEEIFQMDVDDDIEFRKKSSTSSLKASLRGARPLSSSLEKGMNSVSATCLHSSVPFSSTAVDAPSHSWQYSSSSLQLNFENHPFSDGDVTPVLSPISSRPPTPKSDTEYEISKQETSSHPDGIENRWSWTWGEFPVPPKSTSEVKREPPASDDESLQTKHREPDEEHRSVLGGMFRFMRKTKKIRHQPESEGIYLDDLNFDQLDPEVARIYFPQRSNATQSGAIAAPLQAKDEDIESGNGSSLPQSPHSIGGLLGLHGIDSDNEDHHSIFDFKNSHDFAISLCGGLPELEISGTPTDRFLHSIVTYDDFCENPDILNNPDLVVCLNNKYYNWQTVAPMIMSLLLYQRPLADKTIDKLIQDHMPKKTKKSESKSYSYWFSWRRSAAADNLDDKKVDEKNKEMENVKTATIVDGKEVTVEKPIIHEEHQRELRKDESAYASTSSETEEPVGSKPEDDAVAAAANGHVPKGNEKFKKSLRLNSEQLTKLKLREGPNEVVFSVTTAYQGTTRCKCHIYMWHHDDKIVISDIDGTITKSDVLGHILPIIGKDWAQSGVAQHFTKIKNNGYQFLYLSARAIGQAHITREYLKSIRQGDLCLPEGPLLLNPSSLIRAFHREVIEKKPEEFKISCLKDIQALFPTTNNPFYAGYGNRVNDVWAYRAVGIPMTRIFTINYRGELKHELTHSFQSTYTGLSSVVDHVFPPLVRTRDDDGLLTTDFEVSDEYSAFTYWRQPLPDVSFESLNNSPLKNSNKTKAVAVSH